MKRAFKYRLVLTDKQAKTLQANFNFCCFLYNSALQERIDHYAKFGKSTSYAKQCAALPEIKETFPDQTAALYSQTLQQVLKRLDQTFNNFFRRVKEKADKVGFPRYKPAARFRSILFPQSNLSNGGVKLLPNQKLSIFGIPGEVKVRWHRPWTGRCKQVSLMKQAGKFYIVLSCDEVPAEPLPKTGKVIGIDLGITTFITTDEGAKFPHPKPYKTAKEKLTYLNKRLAAKKKGSKNQARAKQRLARAHDKVANVRNDFLHKISRKLVVENDVIIMEKLNIKSMLEAKGFEVNKGNIQDAAWARFASLSIYKASSAGKLLFDIDPRNTSRKCSRCAHINDKLPLSDRTFHCQACGLTMDRDHNAALNIKQIGLANLPNIDINQIGLANLSKLGLSYAKETKGLREQKPLPQCASGA